MSKIDDIITKALLRNMDNGLVRRRFFDEVKSELLTAILAVLPKKKEWVDPYGVAGTPVKDPDEFIVKGFNQALDETTAALQALFGEEK